MRPALAAACFRGQIRGGFWVFLSFFGSKFKALKTALSHGLTGLAAMESVAEMAWRLVRLVRADVC